jgi:type II restriction enzyme
VDGAYATMIARITSRNNPNFFFLLYFNNSADNLFVIPSFFFTPAIIEKRKPLSRTARRAGWVGCNICISEIPEAGRIYLVHNRIVIAKTTVMGNYMKAQKLEMTNMENRGWTLDVLTCVDKIHGEEFSLSQIYSFEEELSTPNRLHHSRWKSVKGKTNSSINP